MSRAPTFQEIPLAPERASLTKVRRLVVKVGTTLLTSGTASVNRRYLQRLAGAIHGLLDRGCEVALVTSGAIGAGSGELGFERPPRLLPLRQACAAAGQVELMHAYAQAFRRLQPPRPVGQLLLTRDGLEVRKRYLNARNTLEALFSRGAIPIINENDTISVDEIRFGDNDTLSALVAVLAEAELLVILTDVEGLMDQPPTENPRARVIHTVPELTPAIEALARPSGSVLGTGGMISKLAAARIVMEAGEDLILAPGHHPEVLEALLEGRRIGTYFPSQLGRLGARKRWLAFSPRTQGTLLVDPGAKDALCIRKKSLLPSGIVGVEGEFSSGDMVAIAGPDGNAFARGLTNYSREEVAKIQGKRTGAVAKILGHLIYEEVVHRDNLVILEGAGRQARGVGP